MNVGNNSQAIKNFIVTATKGAEVGDSDDIFALGLVNSLFALQLVNFIEREFELEVEGEDLHLDNFRSVHAMASFVDRKLRAIA